MRECLTLLGEFSVRPLRLWRERRLDRRLHLDTRADGEALKMFPGGTATSVYNDGVGYAPTPLNHLQNLLLQLPIGDPSDFAFVDLGCGKGRTLFVAAQHGFRPVIGVELNPRLAEIARSNVRAFAEAAPSQQCAVGVFCGDAVTYEFPPTPTVVFLFNPFGADTLRGVLANLERSLARVPRRVLVAYFNAVHRGVLDASPVLHQTAGTRKWILYETRA